MVEGKSSSPKWCDQATFNSIREFGLVYDPVEVFRLRLCVGVLKDEEEREFMGWIYDDDELIQGMCLTTM
jgi:hypothetical protein